MFSKRLMEIPTWICSQKFLPIPELNFEKVVQFCSVQSLSRVRLCDPMDCSMDSLSIINSWSLLKLISIEVVMPSNHLILCHPLLLPSIFPSMRVFSNESALHIRWTKYWSFSFNISPSNEHSGLISFRMGMLDLLAVQGALKSLYSPTLTSIPYYWKNHCLE